MSRFKNNANRMSFVMEKVAADVSGDQSLRIIVRWAAMVDRSAGMKSTRFYSGVVVCSEGVRSENNGK